MDKIVIHNLEFYGAIGVSAAERTVGQRLLLNVEATVDLRAAGRSDDLRDTISYSDLGRTLLQVGQETECQLLEFMAEQMAQRALEHFPITAIRLQLLKKPPPTNMMIEMAGVEIYRNRE